MTLGSNGIQKPAAAPSVAGNLTYEQKAVRGHAGLDSLPGYVLAIFEKRAKGGAIFSRLIKPGETFPGLRIPFLDWSQKYFSVAVNDSVLTYEFTRQVTLDDGNDEFTLNFHLTYRVADFRRVAEIWEHDPLRRLCDEIGRLIARNSAKRKAEMFRERFRELERIVIADESTGLRGYADTLGLKIIRIDLEKPLPESIRDVNKAREIAERDKANYEIQQGLSRIKERDSRAGQREKSVDDLEFKYDQRRRELDRQIELRDRETEVRRADQTWRLMESQTEAVAKAMENVGKGTHTAAEFREGYELTREIATDLQAGREARELPQGFERPQLADIAGSANGDSQLGSLVDRAFRHIDQWNCPRATKQELRSTIFHLVSEAMLDDHADEKILKQYSNKLSEIARGFKPELNLKQKDFLKQFQNVGELRDRLR